MLISGDEPHRFLIHDRDSIYSVEVDRTITAIGLTILKTPARSPQANAFCERLGSLTRYVVPRSSRRVEPSPRQWTRNNEIKTRVHNLLTWPNARRIAPG